MDPPQYGESSRSPQQRSMSPSLVNGNTETPSHDQVERDTSRLILGNWDTPPPKRVHASHDLISLLHLDELYNTYVRPYADALGPDDEKPDVDAMDVDQDGGPNKRKRKGKKAKMEKGYTHLLDDCMDPTPMGENRGNTSLVQHLQDVLGNHRFPQEPPELGPRPEALDPAVFQNARLEAGQKVDGYEEGRKKGVLEEQEKRNRKRAQRQAALKNATAPLPSPALPSPRDQSVPPSPGFPVKPPMPPYTNTPGAKPFFPHRPSGVPGTPGGPPRNAPFRVAPPGTPSGFAGRSPALHGRTPGTPVHRAPGTPGFRGTPHGLPPRPGSAGGNSGEPIQRPLSAGLHPGKRPGDALHHINIKRSKPTGGSRSASPMPPQQSGGTHPTQGRPGVGKQPRSKTEG